MILGQPMPRSGKSKEEGPLVGEPFLGRDGETQPQPPRRKHAGAEPRPNPVPTRETTRLAAVRAESAWFRDSIRVRSAVMVFELWLASAPSLFLDPSVESVGCCAQVVIL
jgi:hypothetical protein